MAPLPPNEQIMHPLIVGVRIKSQIPTCACRNGKWKYVTGTIKRIKENRIRGEQRFFYVLDSGYKVNQDWVSDVL